VINARVFRAGEELTDVPVEDLSELRSEPGTLVWVDVTGGSEEEIDQMGEEFSIHPSPRPRGLPSSAPAT
jgi:Mg2+ and Co2+ transporter CorA